MCHSGNLKACTVSSVGLQLIKSEEQCCLKTYQNLVDGKLDAPTIGWGHSTGAACKPNDNSICVIPKCGLTLATTITPAQADAILVEDLKKYAAGLTKAIGVPLTSNQFSAILSYSYNLGPPANFPKMVGNLNNWNYIGAAAEFTGPRPDRRAREISLFQGTIPQMNPVKPCSNPTKPPNSNCLGTPC